MTDILTNEEARVILGRGISDQTKSSLLDIAISSVTKIVEGQIGPVVYGTVTAEAHSGGGNVIYLNQYPVVSVVSLVEYDNTTAGTLTAETNTSKPADAYLLNAKNGRLLRRSSNADARFAVGADNVVCTYVAGRFATQGSITDDYKFAAAITLKNGWRAWEAATANLGEFEVPQATFPTFAIPKFMRDSLGADWQAGSGGYD